MFRFTKTLAASAAACVLAGGAVAWAHSGVKSYSPKANSAVSDSVTAARVTFKAAVKSGKLTVRGPSGSAHTGSTQLHGNKKQLRVTLKRGLRAGRYTASYKVLNSDGHVVKGTWSFRIR